MSSDSGVPHGIVLPEPELPTEATPPLPGHIHHSGSRSGPGHSSSLSTIDIILEDEAAGIDDEEADVPMAEGGDGVSLPPSSGGLPKAPSTGGRVSDAKFSPLPWEDYFDESKDIAIPNTGNVFHIYTAGTTGPVVFCLHGGGYTGLTFALSAKEMKDRVQVVAVDLRGHGLTRTDNDEDLTAQTLVADVVSLLETLYGNSPPAIVLVGHSMGGAIAVRVAAELALPTLTGLVVVDVVEGSAMASLVHMQAILAARPATFPSVNKAVEWSVRGGSSRNIDSARASVPSQLKESEGEAGRFEWRTKLEASEPCWRGWYEGLSELFLLCPLPKLLLLAGTDRLDKALTIAQMQGKFQMMVIRHSGHAIQEDEPEEFASSLLAFIGRNRIGAHGVEIPGLRKDTSI